MFSPVRYVFYLEETFRAEGRKLLIRVGPIAEIPRRPMEHTDGHEKLVFILKKQNQYTFKCGCGHILNNL